MPKKLIEGATYNMKHHRKGLMRVEIVKDSGEWVEVKILKGHAHFLSVSNNQLQRLRGKGTVGHTLTVRKSLADWEKCTEKTTK